MPKGSPELTQARHDEIVNACAKLYETMSFKEITIKEIAKISDVDERRGWVESIRAGRCKAGIFRSDRPHAGTPGTAFEAPFHKSE